MNTQIVPIPRAAVTVREATVADVSFIDALQKVHRKQVGFMARSWIEEKIAKGEVLVAEEAIVDRGLSNVEVGDGTSAQQSTVNNQPSRLGYIMGVDRYF